VQPLEIAPRRMLALALDAKAVRSCCPRQFPLTWGSRFSPCLSGQRRILATPVSFCIWPHQTTPNPDPITCETARDWPSCNADQDSVQRRPLPNRDLTHGLFPILLHARPDH